MRHAELIQCIFSVIVPHLTGSFFVLFLIAVECYARFSSEGSLMILSCFDSLFSVLVYVSLSYFTV